MNPITTEARPTWGDQRRRWSLSHGQARVTQRDAQNWLDEHDPHGNVAASRRRAHGSLTTLLGRLPGGFPDVEDRARDAMGGLLSAAKEQERAGVTLDLAADFGHDRALTAAQAAADEIRYIGEG